MSKRLLLCLPLLVAPIVAQGTSPAQPPQPNAYLDFQDLTRSGLPIRFYGFLRVDAYYDTARFNSVILPATVRPESNSASPITGTPTAKPNDDEFAAEMRLTRFGFDVLPGEVGGVDVMGRLEFDFASFLTSNSRVLPRIRLAYIDLEQDGWGLRIGQDKDTISPLIAAVNHELVMWNAGNLGDRRLQIVGRHEGEHTLLQVGLGLTGAINRQDLDAGGLAGSGVSTQSDGFDSGLPHLQARAGYKSVLFGERESEFGLWGAFGISETDIPINGQSRFDSGLVGVDIQVPLTETVTFRSEAWWGQNLGDFRGGIGSTINASTGQEIHSAGGWAELVLQASDKTRYYLGATTDNPRGRELASGMANENLVGFVGVRHQWDTGLITAFDALYWETHWKDLPNGNAMRFNLYFQYNF